VANKTSFGGRTLGGNKRQQPCLISLFLQVFSGCRHAIEKRKYEAGNRGFKTECKEVFVFVEINQTKCFISETGTLLKRCFLPSHNSDLREPRSGHPWHIT
jgi:hypothetical protein